MTSVQTRRPSAWRGFLTVLLAVGAVLAGSLSVALSWYSQTVVDEGKFVDQASSLSSDEAFRDDLVASATEDIMNSPQVEQYLGDGHENGLFGGVKNWAREKAQGYVKGALGQAASSSDFKDLWTATSRDTHRANFGQDPSDVVVLDVSPLYRAANEKIRSDAFVDLKLDEGTHLIAVEQKPQGAAAGDEAPVARALHTAKSWSQVLPVWIAVAVVLALAAAVAAPKRRPLVLAAVSAGIGILAWAELTLGRTWALGRTEKADGTGGLILKNLVEALTSNVFAWSMTALGIGVGLAVVFLVFQVLAQSRTQTRETF